MGLKEDMHNEMETIKGDLAVVSKAFHELQTEKQRKGKNFWRNYAIIVTIVCVISNMLWTMYRMSLEKVVETSTTTETVTYDIDTIEQSAEGNNHLDIIGGDKIGNTEN